MRHKIRRLMAGSLIDLYVTAWSIAFAPLFWGIGQGVWLKSAMAESGNAPAPTPTLPALNSPPAGSPPPSPSQPIPGSLELNPAFRDRPYLLDAGDQISVQVQRFPELSLNGQISPEGAIVLPLIGTVNLRGVTVEQAQQAIRDRFNRYIKNPVVTVSLLVQRPVQVTVTGEVARPGFYPIQTPQISAALIAASGTTPTADLRSVRVRRTFPNGTVAEQAIDLLTPLQTGAAPPTLRLEDGDAIFVPYLQPTLTRKSDNDLASRYSLAAVQTPIQVTVAGEVAKPGFYTLPIGSGRISAALVIAGGATAKADLRDVRVRRALVDGSTVEESIDLYTPLANATELFDFPLQQGDTIVVSELIPGNEVDYNRNLIVKSTLVKPRIYVRVLSYPSGGLRSFYIENGSTFLDAIDGVPVNAADLRNIALVRFDRDLGKAISRELDAKEALRGDASQNPILEDNDVIVIGRNLVGRISYVINTFTQPFRDVLGFLLFFQQLRLGAENLFGPTPRR